MTNQKTSQTAGTVSEEKTKSTVFISNVKINQPTASSIKSGLLESQLTVTFDFISKDTSINKFDSFVNELNEFVKNRNKSF